MERKPIQVIERRLVQIMAYDDTLYGLCSDGTLWRQVPDGAWTQLTVPPQPKGYNHG